MGIDNAAGNAPALTPSLDLLKETFTADLLEASMPQGDALAVIRPEALRAVMDFLKNDPRLLFTILVDITAVDYLGRKPRFDVVYHLLSLQFKQRLRIKLRVEESAAQVDSITNLWGSADWLEREIWDMFGIRFSGHPNLKRILMYEEFEGHPLRKDYPIQKRQPLVGPKT